jgi:hypothetical protein
MTPEHKLRVALSGFKGEERERMKILLRKYPSLIQPAMTARLRALNRGGFTRDNRRTPTRTFR